MSAYHNGRSVERERANMIPRDLDSDPQLSQSKASEASGIGRLGPCEGEPRGGPMIYPTQRLCQEEPSSGPGNLDRDAQLSKSMVCEASGIKGLSLGKGNSENVSLSCDNQGSQGKNTGIASPGTSLAGTSVVDGGNVKDKGTMAEIYKAVKSTGVYNYQQARKPVNHELKMDVLRQELVDYPDYDLCDWLEFEWPHSLHENSELQPSSKKFC